MAIRQRVFDALDRVDASPRQHNEPLFQFHNRVVGDYWDQVRSLIELWAEHYPDVEHRDLVGRLRSPIDHHSAAASWELYLHESLVRAGFEVTVHPKVPGSRRPDFLAESADQSFYVEAKALFGKDSGSSARLNAVLDALNQVNSPNFFLSLDIRSVGPRALSTKKLRADLETWLGGLDPDGLEPHAGIEEIGERRSITEDGWDIHFSPLPIKPEARIRKHRIVGSWSPLDGPAESATTIGAALKEKGGAYGDLDHPLILAFNLDSGFDRIFETTNALYGTAMVAFNRLHPDEVQEIRDTDGYWGYPGSWEHRHVSGLLIGPNIGPWSAAAVAPTLWRHPSPTVPLEGLPEWHRMEFTGDRIDEVKASKPINELFGLSDPWPVGEAFPREATP